MSLLLHPAKKHSAIALRRMTGEGAQRRGEDGDAAEVLVVFLDGNTRADGRYASGEARTRWMTVGGAPRWGEDDGCGGGIRPVMSSARTASGHRHPRRPRWQEVFVTLREPTVQQAAHDDGRAMAGIT